MNLRLENMVETLREQLESTRMEAEIREEELQCFHSLGAECCESIHKLRGFVREQTQRQNLPTRRVALDWDDILARCGESVDNFLECYGSVNPDTQEEDQDSAEPS